MGVHSLVTGLNGAGKTLYTVADKLLPLSQSTIRYGERDIPRRLVVGGVPQLLLPHELVEVPEIDPETFEDSWGSVVRERGDPAVRFVRKVVVDTKTGRQGYLKCDEGDAGAEPILWSALNWWAWCEPGDVIVFDECQRLFRPMASGRKVPRFISRLETARHYGVEFIYLTQHAGLLHANVRALIGPHEDVRRIFGSSRVMIYQWDKCNTAGTISKATNRFWKHDKKAFGLYKSSELHTKFAQKLPFAVWALLGGLVFCAGMAWIVRDRLKQQFSPDPAPAATVGPTGLTAAPSPTGQARAPNGQAVARFPVYVPEPIKAVREPLEGRAIQIEGEYSIGSRQFATFGLVVDGVRVQTLSLKSLVSMGYTYKSFGVCAGLLRFNGNERPVTCPPAAPLARPAAAASSPQA